MFVQDIYPMRLFNTFVQDVCSRRLFKTFVQDVCSRCLFKRFVQDISSRCFFETFVQDICSSRLFMPFVQAVCPSHLLRLLLKVFLRNVCSDAGIGSIYPNSVDIFRCFCSLTSKIRRIYIISAQFCGWKCALVAPINVNLTVKVE